MTWCKKSWPALTGPSLALIVPLTVNGFCNGLMDSLTREAKSKWRQDPNIFLGIVADVIDAAVLNPTGV